VKLRFVSKSKILLLAVSLLSSVGLVETGARRGFMLPYNPSADGWWRVMWLKRSALYDSSGTQLAIDKFHPVLGWTLRENVRDANLLGSTVNSNSQGVRGLREYPMAKRSGRRLIAIGDSYTFGEGVDDDQTFAAGLERLLDNSEVLNLGVHGYGTDQQLLRLRIDGLKYRPDFVILGYYEDDISRNRLSFRDYQKPHFSVVNDRLVLDNPPIPSPELFKSRIHFRSLSYLDIFVTAFRERQLQEENIERSKRILDAIFAESRAIQATVIQLYLPTPDQVRANEASHPGLFYHGCAVAGVVCVDPTAAMHRKLEPYDDWKRFFRYHYAPELHQVIARQLADIIAPSTGLSRQSGGGAMSSREASGREHVRASEAGPGSRPVRRSRERRAEPRDRDGL
jgi:hypothetical protein